MPRAQQLTRLLSNKIQLGKRFSRGRANVAPIVPITSMPNFGEASLPDQKAKDIYAYVRSFKNNVPPADQIPVLNQILTGAQRPYKK